MHWPQHRRHYQCSIGGITSSNRTWSPNSCAHEGRKKPLNTNFFSFTAWHFLCVYRSTGFLTVAKRDRKPKHGPSSIGSILASRFLRCVCVCDVSLVFAWYCECSTYDIASNWLQFLCTKSNKIFSFQTKFEITLDVLTYPAWTREVKLCTIFFVVVVWNCDYYLFYHYSHSHFSANFFFLTSHTTFLLSMANLCIPLIPFNSPTIFLFQFFF